VIAKIWYSNSPSLRGDTCITLGRQATTILEISLHRARDIRIQLYDF